MAKIRVYELANESGIASKEMAAKIKDLGYNIKNYMSTLEDYEVQEIRLKLRGEAKAKSETKQETKPKTVVRRKHKTIHLKKIVGTQIQELEPEKTEPAEFKPETLAGMPKEMAEAEETVPIVEEPKKIRAEEKASAEQIERETVEPSQEVLETKDKALKESQKPVVEEQPAVSKPAGPKSFVKILDRPRIDVPIRPEIPDLPPVRPDSTTTSPLAKAPTDVVDASPSSKGRKKTKGKRVVKASELEEPTKKRRSPIRHTGQRRRTKQSKGRYFAKNNGMKTVAATPHKGGVSPKPGTLPPKAGKRKFFMDEAIQVSELAKRMSIKVGDLIMKLMGLGVMATANQSIDYDVVSMVASEFEYDVERKAVAEDLVHIDDTCQGEPVPRPPVITIMGHVDHGKTSLLDAIRKADVASKEAGGITQHIGAYHVTLPSGQEVVFLDTPGHEAFTAMRARGAKVTDIVLLLVAADDGVMAQTREAIDHSRAAGVPIIVAINKIDKPGANPDHVKAQLAELELTPEDWGGETICINISAKEKTGIEELLEMLAIQAEVMELKADPDRPAKGHVVEARLDRGRGPVATLLISEGTLHVGDALVCGMHHGKIRALLNDKGDRIEEAGPSMPVEIHGLSGVPQAGNKFIVLSDDKKARDVAEYRRLKMRETELVKSSRVSLENVFEKLQEKELKELNIVLKTDVQGSMEALSEALRKLSTQTIKVNIVRNGIGAVAESDVLLASASDAIIIGFNVKPSPQAKALAEHEHVEIRFYDVIYNVLDEIRSAMLGLLEPVFKEKLLGHADVRNTFHITKVGTVAGSYVLDGIVQRNARARLLRDNVVIHTGRIESLRRFKDDAKEVQAGYECGIGLERFNDIKVGDIIETFVMEEMAPTLGDALNDRRDDQDHGKTA